MILSIALLLCIMVHSAVATEGDAKLPDGDADKQQLLNRIEALEQRIIQLETAVHPRQFAPPNSTNGAFYPSPPIAPQPGPAYPPHVQPIPPQPQAVPPYQPVPRTQVPETWQPFKFNGQWFYIVPVDQVDARVGQRQRR
jgi:hypothetical protein